MATTCRISGYLYTGLGTVLKQGQISLRLQQDIVSADGVKVAPIAIVQSLAPLASQAFLNVFNVGTPGSTSYFYEVSAVDGNGGETLVGAVASTTTGNAILNATNFNRLTWTAVAGAWSYKVYGRSSVSNNRLLLGTSATTIYDDKGANVGSSKPSVNSSGGWFQQDLIPTVGASPAGISYFVEYDPDPSDTSKPARNKDGYWSNFWAVPNQATQPLGNFVSALRGTPTANYMPIGGTLSQTNDTLTLGAAAIGTTKSIVANQVGVNKPTIRYSASTLKWEISNDGTTFDPIDTPGTAVLWSSVDKTGSTLADLQTRSATDLNSGTLADARLSANVFLVDGTRAGSSTATTSNAFTLNGNSVTTAALLLISATGLTSGSLFAGTIPQSGFTGRIFSIKNNANTPVDKFVVDANGAIIIGSIPYASVTGKAVVNADVAAGAAIGWSKIDKTGSSLLDLSTRSASDLNSGTLPNGRFPAILPASSGQNLTSLDASNITLGTLATARGGTNVDIATSALPLGSGQIAFPATQNQSSSANVLDDYEEGTWTPVIGGTGGTSGQSYSIQNGYYIKIGQLVIAQFTAVLSAKGTITGNVQIQGLPFTSLGSSNSYSSFAIRWHSLATSWVSVMATVNPGTTTADMVGATAAGTSAATQLTTADIANTTNLIGTVIYRANA